MSLTVRGKEGSGSVTIYDVPALYDVQVETVKFQVDTDATAGVHAVRLRLLDPALGSIATLDDLNEGGPSQENFYTYGLGLNASACTLTAGIGVTDALPWTSLAAYGSITLTAINAAGVQIAGDAFSNIVIQLSPSSDGTGAQVDVGKITPAYFMGAQVAA